MKKITHFIFISCLFLNINAQVTQTFSHTGSMQTFTVPSCVSTISLDVRGAEGAYANDRVPNNATGGRGGRVTAVLSVTPGQVLNIFVGGAGNINGNGGFNGGGPGGLSSAGSSCFGGPAGGGGGASDIRIGGIALTDRRVVAGGGGGAGRDYCNGTCQPCGCGGSGGAAGGILGTAGVSASNCGFGYPGQNINGGAPGTATAGGLGGLSDGGGGTNSSNGFCGTNAASGVLGFGGAGGCGTYDVAGGGGGGGYYGGGGGGAASSGSGVGGGGGGGGSSFFGGIGISNAVTTPSFQTGNGSVILTYNFLGAIASASSTPNMICLGNSATLSASGMQTYTWNTGSNASSIIVTPSITTTYTLSATNNTGCVSNAILTVTVSTGLPLLSVTSSTNQTCLGKTATLTATGALSYTWSNGVQNGVSFNPSVTTTYTVFGQNGCGTSSAVTSITVAPIPVQAIAGPSTICYGQASTLTAISGANQYTFAPLNYTANTGVLVVSPTVSTLYTITVSDGTCSGVAQVSLNVNPIPTVAIAASSSLACQGAAVTMTASGGTSYTWYPGGSNGTTYTATPSSPTLYSVVASNSFGCLAWGNQVVLTAPSPTVTISASNTLICAGTTISLTAGGATTYSWNSGATSASIIDAPVTTTVYAVTGYSNTCSNTKTVQVSVFNPTLAITGPTAICKGQTASLTASPADSYTWSTGSPFAGIVVNPSVTTVYSLSALTTSDNITCPSTASVQLVVNPLPTVTAVASKTSVCRGQSFTLTAGGASNYTWSTGATSASLVTSSTLVANVNYTLTGTDVNGCSSSTVITIKVNSCIGIEEQAKQVFNIYPNPSSGLIRIEAETETEITITNALGQHIKTLTLNAQNNFQFIIYDLAPGIYNFNNASLSKKLIIK